MMGVTHKAIGVATGAAIVVYAVGTDQPIYALGMISAPLGAMWPDIDHHNSKLGKANTRFWGLARIIAINTFVGAMASLFIAYKFFPEATESKVLFNSCMILIVASLMLLIPQLKFIQDIFPFIFRHRGIWHTLVIPALIFSSVFKITNEWLAAILIGFMTGYLSHLLADSFTTDRVPAAWPITEVPIGLGIVRTNTVYEYAVAAMLSAAILAVGYYLTLQESIFFYVILALIFVAGMGFGVVFKKKGCWVAALLAVVYVLSKFIFEWQYTEHLGVFAAGYLISYFLRVVKFKQKTKKR